MDKNGDSGSPRWSASLLIQTTEDVAKAVAAAASAATVRSPRPSVVFSSRDENSNSQLQKLQNHVTRVLKGFSPPPQVKKKTTYNPEILTSQKRQWAKFQLQTLDQRSVKEPSKLFENMVVVGLHPNTDIRAIEKHVLERNIEDQKHSRSMLNFHQQVHAEPSLEPNLEPQILFVYPPEKQLPMKYKDLLSFCFPGGLEVHAVERTPSLSELNEILLGQEHVKQSDLSFVFRLQVADDSSLYGCCVYIEEIVQKPSGLISMLSEEQASCTLSRYIITTPRCYCILSRLPFFDLHFGILRSIFNEERFERLTKGIDMLELLSSAERFNKDSINHKSQIIEHGNFSAEKRGLVKTSNVNPEDCGDILSNDGVSVDLLKPEEDLEPHEVIKDGVSVEVGQEVGLSTETNSEDDNGNGHNMTAEDSTSEKQPDIHFSKAVLPLFRYHHYESSESSTSFQGSPCEDRSFRCEMDESEVEEPSSSGQEDCNNHNNILEWAKANNHGSLQIICEYYKLKCPARGSTITFQPLEHLHPLEFHRPAETILHVAGSIIDLRSDSTSLEMAEAQSALLAEEEATALSVWTVACICGSLRLENVLMLFAGVLLEKQIVVVCSNLGILSASVLSVVPLIRPYQWQSLLMPVLPNDMLDFLDAPVPYIVGIKNKTVELQSKLMSAVLVDVNKNQVKSSSMPQLPQYKELFSALSPYHAKLVGESFLARKRPVYDCTDVQVEAAKGFLAVLRSYVDSLCSNLRSHTITNVQSNDDKVSLLLRESFIDSFPSRDRPFMKLFVDTQLFSVHTDLVLSFYQRE